MATVETVNGPVDASELGRTLIHEHLRFRDEAVAEQWPEYYDEDEERLAAVEQVRAAKQHGVRTIVEPTAMFGGRDVGFMQDVWERTRVHIVACTGIYTYDHLPHYFVSRDADQIAEMYVNDIVDGIQGTDVKAGFIKCAADEPGMTENVTKLHRAAARASLQTGVPIMAHSRPASGTGPLQVEVFLEEGVDPAQIQIAHTGDTDDLDYIERLLDTGVWIGLDRYGLPLYLPTEQRNRTTAELLRRGHADRLFLSQDHCATIDWFPEDQVEQLVNAGLVENWTMVKIFEEVIPWLREQDVWDDDVERTVLEDNPRRWLAGA